MKTLRHALFPVLLAALATPALGGAIRIAPSRALITGVKIRPKATSPETGPSKMDKPGPVRSPDPYFTLKLGEAEVYRDALDHTLAYYRPLLRLGKRTDTPLASGVGDLAAELDGFLFRYYKFESGGMPKWADMHVVIVAECRRGSEQPAARGQDRASRTIARGPGEVNADKAHRSGVGLAGLHKVYNRVVGAVGVFHVIVGVPVVLPLSAVYEIAKAVLLSGLQVDRGFPVGVGPVPRHGGRGCVPVVELAHQIHTFGPDVRRQLKRDTHESFFPGRFLFDHPSPLAGTG